MFHIKLMRRSKILIQCLVNTTLVNNFSCRSNFEIFCGQNTKYRLCLLYNMFYLIKTGF